MEASYWSRSLESDATVRADYALTTTTTRFVVDLLWIYCWSAVDLCTSCTRNPRQAKQVSVELLRTLTTWHCPHSPAAVRRAAIDRYLMPVGPPAAKFLLRFMLGQKDRRRTDARQCIDPAPHAKRRKAKSSTSYLKLLWRSVCTAN